MTDRVVLLVPAVLLVLLRPSPAPAQQKTPAPNVGIEQRLNQQIPLDLAFRDEQGKAVTLRQYFGGKPVILVLAYYRCPRLCSLVLNGLVSGLRQIDYEIGNQFMVVTVSIDPRETPELAAAKKAAYAERYGRAGAASEWHFLTGEETAIKRLADAVGYRYAYDAERDQFAHDSAIMVLTPDGTIARYFYGIEYSPRELRFGLEDASVGKIGSPVTRPLRLLCFAYDPTTGKYTLMTLRLVRLAGALSVLVLGIWLFRTWRRETQRRDDAQPTTR